LKNARRAVLLLACAFACMHAFAQATTTTSVPTILVEKSTEEISIPFPTRDNLPRTISFDALTEQEVQMIRQDIYNHPQFAEERAGKVDLTRPNCMQWMFKKGLGKNFWQPIGFFVNGAHGLLNVNGKLRSLYFAIDLNPDQPNPGMAGGASARAFSPFTNYSDVVKNFELMSFKDEGDFLQQVNAKFWTLGLRNQKLIIEQKKTNCSLIDAKCRRYVAKMESLEWRSVQAGKRVTLPIRGGDGLEIAVEDMCPWRKLGLVETNFRSRIWGEQSGIAWHGFPKNPSLIKALEPFVQPKIEQKK
jgi:hypothetical protein